jgi:hypothetical protein
VWSQTKVDGSPALPLVALGPRIRDRRRTRGSKLWARTCWVTLPRALPRRSRTRSISLSQGGPGNQRSQQAQCSAEFSVSGARRAAAAGDRSTRVTAPNPCWSGSAHQLADATHRVHARGLLGAVVLGRSVRRRRRGGGVCAALSLSLGCCAHALCDDCEPARTSTWAALIFSTWLPVVDPATARLLYLLYPSRWLVSMFFGSCPQQTRVRMD